MSFFIHQVNFSQALFLLMKRELFVRFSLPKKKKKKISANGPINFRMQLLLTICATLFCLSCSQPRERLIPRSTDFLSSDRRRAYIEGRWNARREARNPNAARRPNPYLEKSVDLMNTFRQGEISYEDRAQWPQQCPVNNGVGFAQRMMQDTAGQSARLTLRLIKRQRICGDAGCSAWSSRNFNFYEDRAGKTTRSAPNFSVFGLVGTKEGESRYAPENDKIIMQLRPSQDMQTLNFDFFLGAKPYYPPNMDPNGSLIYNPKTPYSLTFSYQEVVTPGAPRPFWINYDTRQPITLAGTISEKCVAMFSDVYKKTTFDSSIEFQYAMVLAK